MQVAEELSKGGRGILRRWLHASLCVLALGAVSIAQAQTATSTTLAASPSPATYGQSVALTATVSGSSPSGAVTFMDGSNALGTATLNAGVASLSTSSLAVGSHTLTAVYGGDASNAGSTSSGVSLTVGKANATISRPVSSANPSTYGTPVTFTVTVTGQSPTGTVSFQDPGYTHYGTVPLVGTGNTRTASLTLTLGAGGRIVAGTYSGDENNNGGMDSYPHFVQTIERGATNTTLSTSPNPSAYPAAVTMTAAVAGPGTVGGNVQFSDGSLYLGSVPISGGVATLSKVLSSGTHNLKADYQGSGNHLLSSSAVLAQVVTQAAGAVTLTSGANPSVASQGVTLTATVTGASPTGNVTFFDGQTNLGTRPLSAGSATLVVNTLASGTHALTAVYNGDANNSGATSAAYSQQVNAGTSSTTLSVSTSTAARGESVTLMARVTGFQPSGVVTFADGATALGTAAVIGGMATLSVNSLAVGAHAITASFPGDGSNAASTSSSVTVTIGPRAGHVWQYGYDGVGRQNTVIDPNGQASYFYYDSLGRRIQSQQPPNTGSSTPTVIQYGYDAMDSLTSVTDPRNLSTTYTRDGLGQSKAQSSPDSGASQFTYDAKGNVLTSTDARGKTTTFTYDALDRVTNIAYATGTPTTFEYDGGANPTPAAAGELTKMTDESGQTTFSYDSMGRMTGKSVVIGTRTFTVGYTWGDSGSALDKLTSITYPSGSRVNYSYDQYGSVSGITVNPVNANGQGVSGTAATLLSGITYNADNRVTGWLWSDGKPRTIGYDSNGMVSSYTLGDPLGTGNAAGVLRSIQRDAAGRITGYTHTNNGNPVAGLNQTFGYDNLDRLTTATQAATTTQYTYDETGNRTAKTIGGTTYSNTVSPTSNRLAQVQDPLGTGTIGYDAAGNTVGDGSFTYTYSDRGRMASVTTGSGTVSYAYNGFGLRARKSGPSGLVASGAGYFVYDEAGQLLGEYDANGAALYETAYLGSTPVGVVKHTGSAGAGTLSAALYNVHADHIDTPRLVTAQDQAVVWRWDFAEAFGATAPDQNPSGLGSFAYNQRFPGQVFDSETGLFQNWSREYNARLGRYIQSDPIGLAGGINTFSYADAQPLNLMDPMGLSTGAKRSQSDSKPAACQDDKCTTDPDLEVSCFAQCPDGASCQQCCHAQASKMMAKTGDASKVGMRFIMECTRSCVLRDAPDQRPPSEPPKKPWWCSILPWKCKVLPQKK